MAEKRASAPRQSETPVRETAVDLTGPVEDYLKAIYDIERDQQAAATNEIAQRLQIAPASVSGMVRRLAEQGLLEYERYKGVKLTAAGRRAALRTIRRHRVIEAYLVQALGYSWDVVHEEAERLEHAASDDLIDRMATAIGEPSTDPHGAPIPTRDGRVDERRHRRLSELRPGQRALVTRVGDEDPELLRYLASLGLLPNATVTLDERAPFEGPLTIRVEQARYQVGTALAERVLVELLPD
ncbi:MAG: Transcriptional regulator MntR [Gemmatimonadaceae bacterium]|nr:Transcriptional regulator MntR [Gemmatimonadaceae bacterium]